MGEPALPVRMIHKIVPTAGTTEKEAMARLSWVNDHFLDASSFNMALSCSASPRSFFGRASLKFLEPAGPHPRSWPVSVVPAIEVDSAMPRWRSTAARSLSSFRSRSPSRTLRTAC